VIGHGVPGLNIQQSYVFPVPCEIAFAALTQGIDHWWPRDWRQLGPTGRLTLRAEVGAAMTEASAKGDMAIWGWVDALSPPHTLHMQGHFGIEGAVAGRVEFDLTDAGDGCNFAVSHQAIGPVPEDRGGKFRATWRKTLDIGLREYLLGVAA